MGGGLLVVLADQMERQGVGAQPGQAAEEVPDVRVRTVEALGDGVDLGAVAGGEEDDLRQVRSHSEVVEGLGPGVTVEGDPLEDGQRRRAVIDADHHDGHGRTYLRRSSDPTIGGPYYRPTPRKPSCD